eukprot:180271-Pleurochrysis_carterae.AAC.1
MRRKTEERSCSCARHSHLAGARREQLAARRAFCCGAGTLPARAGSAGEARRRFRGIRGSVDGRRARRRDAGALARLEPCGGRVGKRRRRPGFRCVECDARSHGVRDKHVQVRRVCGVRGGLPTFVVAGAAHMGSISAVCACQRGQTAEHRLEARRAHERCVLLDKRTQRALWEGYACTRVAGANVRDSWDEPEGSMSLIV